MTTLTTSRPHTLTPSARPPLACRGLLRACTLADGTRWGLAGAIVALVILGLLTLA